MGRFGTAGDLIGCVSWLLDDSAASFVTGVTIPVALFYLAVAAWYGRNDVAVLAAALVEKFTGYRVDGYMGMAVALFILYSAVGLAKETISPLLGESASPELSRLIAQMMEAEPRVLGFHDLMVHDYGPGQRFGSLHVEMDQAEDPLSCHELIDDLERLCLEQHNRTDVTSRCLLILHCLHFQLMA